MNYLFDSLVRQSSKGVQEITPLINKSGVSLPSGGWFDIYQQLEKTLLKENGVFARFASHPFANIEGQEELFERTQCIYFEYMPNPTGLIAPNPFKRYTEEDAERRSEIAKKYGFSNIETKTYYRDLTYTSDEYLKRLEIESDKIALPRDIRTKFLHDFKNVIDEYGGKITIRDMIDLNLARK